MEGLHLTCGFWAQSQSGDCDGQVVRAPEHPCLRQMHVCPECPWECCGESRVSALPSVIDRAQGTLITVRVFCHLYQFTSSLARPLFMLKMVFVTDMFCQGPQSSGTTTTPCHSVGAGRQPWAPCEQTGLAVFQYLQRLARARLGPWAVICRPGLK